MSSGPMHFTVFVAKNGNDANADGSDEKPFLTVQAAMNFAWTTYVAPLGPQPAGSDFVRPCVFVNAGTYDDGPLVLPPQICVFGEGYNHSRIVGAWSLDARWTNTPSVGNDFRSMFYGLHILSPVVLDWRLFASIEGKFVAINTRFFNAPITAVDFSAINQLLFDDCEFFNDIDVTGCQLYINQCASFAGTLFARQSNVSPSSNLLQTSSGNLSNLEIDATLPGPATPYTADLGSSILQPSAITLSGAFSSVAADVSSLPALSKITLAGGATLAQIALKNTALGLGYVPSNLADWSGTPPVSVQNALDRIAAKITPIP
jgi:hypothetical protein